VSARASARRAVVRAPEDRRFRRARLGPAIRRRRDRALALLAAVRVMALVGLVAGGGWFVAREFLASPYFRVTRIVVSGNVRLSSGEVLALLDGLQGRSLLRLDLEEWRRRVLASPWVESAELRRVMPGSVEVRLVERRPLGIGRIGGRLHLLDERGQPIDDFGPQYADIDLPVIDGLGAPASCGASACADDEARAAAAEARAALAGGFLHALSSRPHLLRRVSQVDVSDPRDAVVLLDGDTALLHVGDADFVSRLQSYLELEPTLKSRVPEIDYVDLRFNARVFVRPSGGRAPAVWPAAGAR
jgi:cell division septal protein FtsQ